VSAVMLKEPARSPLERPKGSRRQGPMGAGGEQRKDSIGGLHGLGAAHLAPAPVRSLLTEDLLTCSLDGRGVLGAGERHDRMERDVDPRPVPFVVGPYAICARQLHEEVTGL